MLFLLFVLVSCEAQIQAIVSSASSQKVQVSPSDYTDNLFDEWVANRGFNVKDNNTDINSWTGYRSGTALTPDLSFGIPTSGELDVSGNKGMQLPSTSAVTGNVSFAFVIKMSSRQNAEQRLFHAVSAPQMILKMEMSSSNHNIGILYTSTNYDFGYEFPKDDTYHVLVFKINSGANASIYVDGVKVGSTVTFSSSTAIDWTSSNTRRFFRTASTGTVPFVGSVKKIRVYKESLSDQNITLISNHSNAFFVNVSDETRIHRIFGEGQSLEMGTGIFSELPSYLQVPIPNVYFWDFNFRKWVPYDAGNLPLNTAIGSLFQIAYRMHVDYPNDLIYVNSYARGGRSLAVDYNPDGSADHYNLVVKYYDQSNIIINIEQRTNIVNEVLYWGQGEADTQVEAWANAYDTNLGITIPAMRTKFNVTKVVGHKIHNALPNGNYPYMTTVRSKQDAYQLIDSNFKLLNIDNSSRFPRQADLVHLQTTGYINMGDDEYDISKTMP